MCRYLLVRVLSRDKRAQQIIDDELNAIRKTWSDQMRIVEADAFERIERFAQG